MKKEVSFVNRIVKQGNSLCVRIPNSIVKEGKLKEGMEVLMSMVPQEVRYDYDKESIEKLLDISNRIRNLDKFSETEKRLFLVLNFDFLRYAGNTKLENITKKSKEYSLKLSKEFGKIFSQRFDEFEIVLNREAFITEKDGICVLKPEYR
ncbi:MAG: hypothetical protein ABIJ34_00885 [archaeon]